MGRHSQLVRMSVARTALAAFGLLAVFGTSTPTSLSAQGQVDSLKIVSSAGADNTYGFGDTIKVRLWFSVGVDWSFNDNESELSLTIGTTTRKACAGTSCPGGRPPRSGFPFRWLEYWYHVAAPDLDADGISIASNALDNDLENSNTGLDITRTLTAITNAAAHKVNGLLGLSAPAVSGVAISSSAGADSTYSAGDTITAQVVFDAAVAVTGAPRLALWVGAQTRQASYASGTGTDTLVFQYVVVAADLDADGLSIGSSALALNSGTIRRSGTTQNAALGLGTHAITNAAAHKVSVPASVGGVAISSSPVVGDTYMQGDTIAVAVAFTHSVAVTGTPQLALTVGTQARQASYASGTGTDTLVFRYVAAAADADLNGLSIGASALGLNGGTINDARDASVAANLGLGSHAVTDAAAHKVNGGLGPEVTDLAISSPTVGDTFEPGETIEVRLVFNRAVDVTGTPRLALGIGSATRQAGYASGTGTDTLVFRYVVATGDADADGLSIGASALTLNGGTIKTAGRTADATLGLGASVVVTNSGNHKVTGTATTPAVSAVTISSTPASDSTYGGRS